ncbi:MAG TPA: M23 family metallopeptidase [Gaiellaceae bacterium]|nr:M23 family metallopeptidase [Gaiellaceae bacterium]
MRARLYLALAATALVFVGTCAAAGPGSKVPPLLFPVVGSVSYGDDFGDPRGGARHEGNDILAAKRASVVAVEDGTVEYWTRSASAGCMLYLHGASGTSYQYIHLNNDRTAANDNKGKCVRGTAYAVADGARVTAGQQIGYVGDSGDANGIHPHLHFEVHPNGKGAVDPFPYLRKAARLLAPAPSAGRTFTLKLSGTVAAASANELTMVADSVAAWPSHVKQSKLGATVSLTLTGGETFLPGEQIVAWTEPAPGTVAALTGAPGALELDRFASG